MGIRTLLSSVEWGKRHTQNFVTRRSARSANLRLAPGTSCVEERPNHSTGKHCSERYFHSKFTTEADDGKNEQSIPLHEPLGALQ
jgi:hypothetical protein